MMVAFYTSRTHKWRKSIVPCKRDPYDGWVAKCTYPTLYSADTFTMSHDANAKKHKNYFQVRFTNLADCGCIMEPSA